MTKRAPTPKARPRGTGTIRYRGGNHEARWRGDDGREIAQRFPTEKAAAEHLDRELVRKREARDRGERYVNPNATGPKLGDVAEEWYADRALKLTSKTLLSYRSALDVHILPAFGRSRSARSPSPQSNGSTRR